MNVNLDNLDLQQLKHHCSIVSLDFKRIHIAKLVKSLLKRTLETNNKTNIISIHEVWAQGRIRFELQINVEDLNYKQVINLKMLLNILLNDKYFSPIEPYLNRLITLLKATFLEPTKTTMESLLTQDAIKHMIDEHSANFYAACEVPSQGYSQVEAHKYFKTASQEGHMFSGCIAQLLNDPSLHDTFKQHWDKSDPTSMIDKIKACWLSINKPEWSI